jgi:hypothetical protein
MSAERPLTLQTIKESQMTLVADARLDFNDDAAVVPVVADSRLVAESTQPAANNPVVVCDPTLYVALLEDPALSFWAREAGAKYLVSDVEALWLLAQALLLDGERPKRVQNQAGDLRTLAG